MHYTKYLEYCILESLFIKDVKLIGNIQRRATKMIQGIQHWKYDDRLNYLGIAAKKS